MKRLAGQAGRTVGYFLHHTGMLLMTMFFVITLGAGALAYRLSLGPIQVPWATAQLANFVSGKGVQIRIGHAALAWGGFKKGAGVPLFLQLADITAQNQTGVALVAIPAAKLEFLPGALLGGQAPVLVTSQDALFAGSSTPVSLQASIHLGVLKFSSAILHFNLGAGTLNAGNISLPISSGSFSATITASSAQVQAGRVVLAATTPSPPVIGFSGSASLDQTWQATLTLTADQLQAAQLQNYWPAGLVSNTRNWVTKNITSGSASNARFTLGISAPASLASLSLTSASGHFNGQNLSIGWVPRAEPIIGVEGVFTLQNLETINITASAGTLHGLSLAGARMVISGVSDRNQTASLTAPVSGDIASALQLLNAPPLRLMQAAPPSLLAATGTLNGTVTADFPLDNDLKIEQVNLQVSTSLTNVILPTPLAGLALQDGNIKLSATTAGLQANGTATLDSAPATLSATASFATAQPAISFNLQTTAKPALLRRFGFDDTSPNNQASGTASLNLQINQNPNGRGLATLKANLTNASLGISALGWHKKAGDSGTLTLTAPLAGESLTGLASISAQAPGLLVAGKSSTDDPHRLDLSQLQIGGTLAAGFIKAPQNSSQAWQISLNGPTLDLSGLINASPAGSHAAAGGTVATGAAKPPPQPAAPPSGPLWQADLHFEQLVLNPPPSPALRNLAFLGNGQGASVFNAQADAATQTGQPVKFTLARATPPSHIETLHLAAGDAGSLLRAFGSYANMQGGTLDLNATYPTPGTTPGPLSGQLGINQYRLMHAPILGKILQGISIYGVADAASGPGLAFDRLVAPFSYNGGIITLNNARAFSSSLGLTATGTIALDDDSLQLDTTIIPAYALNAAPGKIPLLGKLFSAETGGGLFAVRARITGTLQTPNIAINPLSALTPGALRDIFAIGSNAPALTPASSGNGNNNGNRTPTTKPAPTARSGASTNNSTK